MRPEGLNSANLRLTASVPPLDRVRRHTGAILFFHLFVAKFKKKGNFSPKDLQGLKDTVY